MGEAKEKNMESNANLSETESTLKEDVLKQGNDRAKAATGVTEYNISWLGSPGATNSASMSTYYTSGSRYMTAVVTGTATWGLACVISAVPQNYKLKSGASKVTKEVLSQNFGTTLFLDITPAAGYENTTLKVTATISGGNGTVFYAHGSVE